MTGWPDIRSSLQKLDARDDRATGRRRPRSDRGVSRLTPECLEAVRPLLCGQDRPSMTSLLDTVRRACAKKGCEAPSRAALYQLLDRVEMPTVSAETLPRAVRQALYNVDATTANVPPAQIVFYCFNYGNEAALCYGASMPWLALHQAESMRGFRPKSLALLRAVMLRRGILQRSAL